VEVRSLLTPGVAVKVAFSTSVVSRRMSRESRLVMLLDVNKNPFAQVTYGTGQDVSAESVADARAPLEVRRHTDSFIRVPIGRLPKS
jgi:uncharacterized protein